MSFINGGMGGAGVSDNLVARNDFETRALDANLNSPLDKKVYEFHPQNRHNDSDLYRRPTVCV